MTTVGVEPISAREAEVLDALGEHLTNAQIAQRLHISVRTVESHVSSLLRKLGAGDRRDLAAQAVDMIVVPPPASQDIVGLPASWTSFVGRTAELEDLVAALSTDRFVSLVGPGGVGKTRLAVMAASRSASGFPGGGAFVDLLPATTGFVVQAVATALGVAECAHCGLDEVVFDRLGPAGSGRSGRTLLVLDNCEHVLPAVASFVQSLLSICPHAVVLATSRERLGVAGERVVALAPLSLLASAAVGDDGGSEAELLFRDRAARAPGMAADHGAIAEICRRLDGMPLAIELAAARSHTLGLDGVLAGLDDQLRLLSRSHAPGDRHGSLRTVMQWSYQLLDADERKAFRRLAVFAGSFDLASACTVAGSGEDDDVAVTSDLIGRLADKSLLVHGQSEDGSRWRMLDTVHAYAREQLVAGEERDQICRRHLRWAATTARQLEESLTTDTVWQWRFDKVVGDLRAAVSYGAAGATAAVQPTPVSGDGRSAVPGAMAAAASDLTACDAAPPELRATTYQLAMSLGHLAYARRFLLEARNHLATAAAVAPSAPEAVAALRQAAAAAYAEMRGQTAYELLQDAFGRAVVAGDRRAAAITLAQASAIGGRCPALFAKSLTHDELTTLVERACSLAPSGDLEVDAYLALAKAWDGALGHTIPTPEAAREAVETATRFGDLVLVSSALDAASSSAAAEDRFGESLRLTTERVALLDRLPRHDPRVGGEVADIFHMASDTALAAGQLRLALAHAERSIRDTTAQGLPHIASCHMVTPLVLLGDFDAALEQAAIMREGWTRAGRPQAGWMTPAFFWTATVYGVRGDDAAYRRWWDYGAMVSGQFDGKGLRVFTELRVALHRRGDLDRIAATEQQVDRGMFRSFVRAMQVEYAVVSQVPDAAHQLADAWHLGEENPFVAAHLLRAAGRLHHDQGELEASVTGWEDVGARFERACTLALLPQRRAEAEAELAALGCPPPATP